MSEVDGLNIRCKHVLFNALAQRGEIPAASPYWQWEKETMDREFNKITRDMVARYSRRELLRMPNLGVKSAHLITAWLYQGDHHIDSRSIYVG